jgi:beta-glucosidase
MKKIIKIIGVVLLSILALVVILIGYIFISAKIRSSKNLSGLGEEAKTITVDGFAFRDLNKNGKLDPYEDRRQPVEKRVDDLLGQMTVEEKAGTMFYTIISTNSQGDLSEAPEFGDVFSFLFPSNSESIIVQKINHFNLLKTPPARQMALWQNNVQKLAARTRLGIPITLGSDPRNHFSDNPMTSMLAGDFSQWPEPMGLAALDDSALTEKFADIARQEYLSVGIRMALHPMADMATEPRWPRISGTFGEDATIVSRMVSAYIRGFQGDSLGSASVACMTKHFPGGGPQKEGLDPHFQFQKGQVYPGHNFKYHLIPFEAAFAAGTAAIMPYYGVAMGQTSEDVGFSFNKEIITGLLRDKYHFDGVVCTDWGIISDASNWFISLPARAHGVMNLTPEQRMLKAINAGVDQFGGENIPEMLVKLVKEGKISEERINQSVRRILRLKFKLGLFDNPFVDVDLAAKTVGRSDFRSLGAETQRKALVLLKNGDLKGKKVLPLSSGLKIYTEGIDKHIAARYATVVDDPSQADMAIIRIQTPYEPRKGFVESLFHHGDLDFKDEKKKEILSLLEKVPTIVNLYADRPAVIPEIADKSAGLIVNFGATDDAILDVIFGKYKPMGKMPFELPSSMEAVRQQKEDVPYDSQNPLYPFGFGLSY